MNVDEVIQLTLLTNDAAMWRQAWQAATKVALAEFAADLIDFDNGTAGGRWRELDDAAARERIAANNPTATIKAAEMMMERHAELNAAIVASGHRTQSNGQLRKRLIALIPALLAEPVSETITATSPFPDLWNEVAHALSRRISAEIDRASSPMMEWRLLNRLLLAGYFASSRLMFAVDAQNDLTEKARCLVPVRGPLIRLVQAIGANGVRDGAPPLVLTPCAQLFTLRTSGISALLAATETETNAVRSANGLVTRLVGVNHPLQVPPGMQGNVDIAAAMNVRKAMFRQYEQTIVTYITLASIEQLLRGWATKKGVPHLSPNGRPIAITKWVGGLGATIALVDAISNLYEVKRSNLRNRFLHGGLFDVESTRVQVSLTEYFPARYPRAIVGVSPYSPDNVAQVCATCLLMLDGEAAAAGVVAADVMWADQVFLAPGEVLLGHQLSSDFFSAEGPDISAQIGDLLSAAAPAIGQFARIGMLGWYSPSSPPDPLPRFMALLIIFEALYRVVAHLSGIDVLQRDDVNKRYQYKMLDGNGLCSPTVVSQIVEFLPAESRPNASRVLMLAVKARDALAHGAIRIFTTDTLDGAGHLVTKSMHLLVASALYHMAREAAYYRRLNSDPNKPHDQVGDWLWAERQILSTIHMGRNA